MNEMMSPAVRALRLYTDDKNYKKINDELRRSSKKNDTCKIACYVASIIKELPLFQQLNPNKPIPYKSARRYLYRGITADFHEY